MAKVRVASSNATWKSSRSSAEAYRQNGLRMRQLSLYREPHTYKCGLSGKAITASIPKENRLLQSHDRNCTLALFRTCVRTGEKAITRRFPLLRGHHFPPGTARTRCFPTTEKPGAPADARNSFPTHRQSPPGRGLSCSEVWSSRRAPLFPGGQRARVRNGEETPPRALFTHRKDCRGRFAFQLSSSWTLTRRIPNLRDDCTSRGEKKGSARRAHLQARSAALSPSSDGVPGLSASASARLRTLREVSQPIRGFREKVS